MKKKLNIICLAVALCFASCQKDPSADQMSDTNKVSFSAESISSLTRVTNNEWDEGDAIGITMLKSSNQNVLYDNIKYLAAESAASVSLTPDSDSETIYYSEDGEGVDFIAFYPYDEEWSFETSDAVFDISSQDGTQDAQDKVDLLSSKNLTNQTSGTQVFQFGHALAKVQITVSNYHELSAFTDLSSLAATLYTDYVQYDVANDTRVSSSETQVLKMVQASYDEATDEAVFTVIVVPSADAESDRIIFTDEMNYYEATLALTSIEAGKQYNFSAVVGDTGMTYVELTADGSISWDVQTDVSLTKDIELQGDTYMIYSAAGLKLFATLVNGGKTTLNGCLMNDIDLDGSETNQWTPIGWYTSSTENCGYSGSFDGGGYEVKGLYINNSSSYQGLFGYAYGANISNLGVSGEITAGSSVGGIVGYCNGTTDNTSVITGCYNNVTVTGTSFYVGGIAGAAEYSEIDWCYNTGVLSSAGISVGGIVGYFRYGSMESCYNTGSVTNTGSSSGSSYAGTGGIVGWFLGNYGSEYKITNCYNTGEVTAGSSNYVGGITGYINGGAYVTNSYNTATVKGVESVGGVVGFVNGGSRTGSLYIENCYNTGGVVGTSNLGGVIGYASYTYATNCSYDSSTCSYNAIGYIYSECTETNVLGVSDLSTTMTNGEFATTLNGDQDSAPWDEDTDNSNSGYPVLSKNDSI
ncbi:MAG: fimbrillin family protein [Rikenellaceae bacterium]